MTATASTSIAAFRGIKLMSETMREQILEVVEIYGEDGCIMDDLKTHIGDVQNSTLSGQIKPLELDNLIFRNGDVRVGKSGFLQKVMRHAKYFGTTPMITARPVKNPFFEGVKHAAKVIIAADPSLKGTKAAIALKNELKKIARR